ncbi:hypothetical protein NE619_04310 [Anaerovorax odorimutans]|uniref:YkgJ family cysteine cluster protein n=1 Tax=Anaerovorax odorimutans TaxID=109327 RepID=A0ABT1RLA1_9FIRM|nr:hypothetical protein [Anaerovorax odorimutans]MCQ4635940.1 hypothetical protein [Anaerovorax odorimutans]
MKSTIRKSTYQAIYRLLDRVSPLESDCGKLCGAACCTCGGDSDDDDFQLGIYLLPGEEKLFSQKEEWLKWSAERAEDFDFPDSWFGKIHFIRCKTPPVCPREHRPLQCRFFPLAPHLTEEGELRLILCTTPLPYSCPLIDRQMKLTPSFIQATYTVWTHLIRDPLIYDLVLMDSEDREAEGVPVKIVR